MDNIFTERLWRTVKYENIYLREYQDLVEAEQGLKKMSTLNSTIMRGRIRLWITGGLMRPIEVNSKGRYLIRNSMKLP